MLSLWASGDLWEEPGAGKPHARICEGESQMAELLDRIPPADGTSGPPAPARTPPRSDLTHTLLRRLGIEPNHCPACGSPRILREPLPPAPAPLPRARAPTATAR
jgi:hypothetical protein